MKGECVVLGVCLRRRRRRRIVAKGKEEVE